MAQIEKLVQVYRVVHLSKAGSMSRELALVKIKSSDELRQEIMSVVEVFHGHIIDFNAASMVIEVTNDSRKIDSFCDIMQKYGIIEIIRTGEISLSVEPIGFTEFI